MSGGITVKYKLVSKSKITNVTNKKQILARCGNTGGICNLTTFSDSTRTFGLSLGIKVPKVAGELNISKSKSVTVGASAQCTSRRKLKSNEIFVAYPMGSRHKYKVKRTVAGSRNRSDNGTTTSGWKYTYNPYKVGIDCYIIKR